MTLTARFTHWQEMLNLLHLQIIGHVHSYNTWKIVFTSFSHCFILEQYAMRRDIQYPPLHGWSIYSGSTVISHLRWFFKVNRYQWNSLVAFNGTLLSTVQDRLEKCADWLQFNLYWSAQTIHLASYNYWPHCVLTVWSSFQAKQQQHTSTIS